MSTDTNFYNLKVAEKKQETPDAVTLYFEVPDDLKETFKFQAGQYLTLKIPVNGHEERRSYSLCTTPEDPRHGVTVKRVKNGKVSGFLCDEIAVGSSIEVMPPEGRFTVDPDPEQSRTYYFFGAGSGITPLMSQIRTILEKEPLSAVHLYYGNRDTDSIIFKSELEALEERYKGQLTVDFILSRVNKGGVLGGLFGKKKKADWGGETGRITDGKVKDFLNRYPLRGKSAAYHICGPGNMIENVKKALSAHGVSIDDVHTEYFTTPDEQAAAAGSSASDVASKATVTLRGETIEVQVNEKTILETLEDAGYDPPFSCTSGACATCMAKVTRGSARMEMCFALSEQEIEDGYILTCQSHPTTDEIELTYDY